MSNKMPIYHEKCMESDKKIPAGFTKKLREIQKILLRDTQSNITNDNIYYKLGNIVWSDDLINKITNQSSFPSSYFIDIVSHTDVYGNKIINPPLQLEKKFIKNFHYIPLDYNKLLIIDALMDQGSCPRYKNKDRFIYSEHSGVISISDGKADQIIVSTNTNRTDIGDDSIYLPINTPIMGEHEYLFHTHPNTMTYGGRVNEGVLYELPSANDIFNFIKYYNEGKALASLIVAPEGAYLIRPIYFVPEYDIRPNLFHYLRKFIIKLEKNAIKKYKKIIPKLSNPDVFHQKVGSDYKYIDLYNKFIKPANLYVEYYPREKKNGEWVLRQINLPYVS